MNDNLSKTIKLIQSYAEPLPSEKLNELKELLKTYLQYRSLDGNPKRQELRAKLAELIKDN